MRCEQIVITDKKFQSTPSTRRETSIASCNKSCLENFNPLPPHGGRPRAERVYPTTDLHFNPLPPHGGRRRSGRSGMAARENFNPLPPHGGRLFSPPFYFYYSTFQSTPSTRRETSYCIPPLVLFAFQSTPSTRRETKSM